jgi:hypothetical protein
LERFFPGTGTETKGIHWLERGVIHDDKIHRCDVDKDDRCERGSKNFGANDGELHRPDSDSVHGFGDGRGDQLGSRPRSWH